MIGELVERIARAVIIGSGGERAADHAKEFDTANWADAKRSALEVIPIINAEIAAERERCAVIAEGELWAANIVQACQRDGDERPALHNETCEDIAKAIRSQPCKN